MKLKKIDIADFKGIGGPSSYALGHVTALCSENGSGKTSFLSALRYGLTGVEPEGEMVKHGAARAVVQIETASGNKYGRAKYAQKGKPAKYFFGGKTCTLADLNRHMQAENGGVAPDTARIASSGELIESLNAQKFSELLMQYLPEALDADQIISMLPEPSEKAQEIVKTLLPKEDFGSESIDAAYAKLTEMRRLLKKKLTESEAVVKSMNAVPAGMTEEKIRETITQVQKERDEAAAFKSRKEAYETALASENKRKQTIAQLEKELGGATLTAPSPKMRENITTALQTAKDAGNSAYLSMREIKKEADMLIKAIQTIRQPVCPLSEKLTCTTDKTPIISELQTRYNELRTLYAQKQEEFNKYRDLVEKTQAKLDAFDKEAEKYRVFAEKKKLKDELEKNAVQLPDPPVMGKDVAVLDTQLAQLRKNLQDAMQYAKAAELKASMEQDCKVLQDLEMLVSAFSPKGAIKETIREGYLRDFAAGCNEKAKSLFNGMTIRFSSDSGIETEVDVRGNGMFIPYSALSGGERACVTYILMDMLSRLSGFKTIILDELSVLDKETLKSLLSIIMQHKDEYDLVLIAAVNHDDTLAVINGFGIPVIGI